MPTVSDVIEAFAYYIGHGGYYEKRNGTAKYLTNDLSNFAANAGSANYTYMGKLCGINPGSWCAMMVSTAVYEGCGSDMAAAKKAMWGVWPYTACNQLYDAAPSTHKGRRGSWSPKPGDVIVFSDNGSIRTHTGMVYAVDDLYIYTYEGNSGNMARKRSYRKTSSYIWGYVRLNLDAASEQEDTDAKKNVKAFQRWLGVSDDGVYGPATKKAIVSCHQRWLNSTYKAGLTVDGIWGAETYYATENVQKGDENNDVLIWQGLLYCLGYDPVALDGTFGNRTEQATEALQTAKKLNATGIADRYTWAKALGYTRPTHTVLKRGSKGQEVRYMQRLLFNAGFPVEIDGKFGANTEKAVKAFKDAIWPESAPNNGVVGTETWAKLE